MSLDRETLKMWVCGSDENEICEDILKKLRETGQIYIVEHDVPISVSKHVFRILDEKRRLEAKRRGIPEEQYEWEDLLFYLAIKDGGKP